MAGSLVVAVDVAQQPHSLSNAAGSSPPCFSRLSLARAPGAVEIPAGLGHADHRHVEVAALDHRLQRREDLLVGQVAGGAEEDQGVGMGVAHRASLRHRLPASRGGRRTRSAWPTAACSAKSASPRELKRS